MKFLFGLLAGGFLLFQTQATPRKVAGKIESALRRRYPGATVEARVEGKRGKDVLKGRFRSVTVRVANFRSSTSGISLVAVPGAKKKGFLGHTLVQLSNFSAGGVPVTALNLELNDVVYDRDALVKRSQLAIVSAGAARSEILVPARSFETLVAAKLPEVQNFHLSFSDGLVRVAASRELPLSSAPLEFLLTARPVARGSELRLDDVRIKIGQSPMVALDESALGVTLLGNINPIYVFDREGKFPFRIVRSSAVVRDDLQGGALQLSSEMEFVPAAKAAVKASAKAP